MNADRSGYRKRHQSQTTMLGTKVLYEFYLNTFIFLISILVRRELKRGGRSVGLGLLLVEFIVSDSVGSVVGLQTAGHCCLISCLLAVGTAEVL